MSNVMVSDYLLDATVRWKNARKGVVGRVVGAMARSGQGSWWLESKILLLIVQQDGALRLEDATQCEVIRPLLHAAGLEPDEVAEARP